MTNEEIDALNTRDLVVAYAEIAKGYDYRPSKTQNKPWYLRGFPNCAALPDYMDWKYIQEEIQYLISPNYNPYKIRNEVNVGPERLEVDLFMDWNNFLCEIRLVDGSKAKDRVMWKWTGSGIYLGEAFLIAATKCAVWFRGSGWTPS